MKNKFITLFLAICFFSTSSYALSVVNLSSDENLRYIYIYKKNGESLELLLNTYSNYASNVGMDKLFPIQMNFDGEAVVKVGYMKEHCNPWPAGCYDTFQPVYTATVNAKNCELIIENGGFKKILDGELAPSCRL